MIGEDSENGLSATFRRQLEGLRQDWVGLDERLSGISKRGDAYIRTRLIHGARAVLRTAANKHDPRSRWVVGVSQRRHRDIAAVALANKNARIAWALLTRGGHYDSPHGVRIGGQQYGAVDNSAAQALQNV
jgi:hypothetical protein